MTPDFSIIKSEIWTNLSIKGIVYQGQRIGCELITKDLLEVVGKSTKLVKLSIRHTEQPKH